MLVGMKRTQLDLDDDLWAALQAEAEQSKSTVADVVRTLVRDHYSRHSESRRKALMGIIGIRRDLPESPTAEEEVRALRRSSLRIRDLSQA